MVWLISCPKKAVFDDVGVEVFLRLQQQGAGAAGGVVDFIDAGLLVHGQPRDQPGDVLRSEELATGFAGIGGIVGDEELVGVAEEINLVPFEITEFQATDPREHGGEAAVFVFDGVAEAVAGGVEVGEQAFNVLFRRIAIGGALDSGEDGGEVGIQAVVGVGAFGDVGEQLAGIDEVAFGLDGVILDRRRDDLVGQFGVANVFIAALDVGGKVFTDEAVEQGAEDVLLEIPAIDGSSNIVRDFPNLAL